VYCNERNKKTMDPRSSIHSLGMGPTETFEIRIKTTLTPHRQYLISDGFEELKITAFW
jgi:hypothetical protein